MSSMMIMSQCLPKHGLSSDARTVTGINADGTYARATAAIAAPQSVRKKERRFMREEYRSAVLLRNRPVDD